MPRRRTWRSPSVVVLALVACRVAAPTPPNGSASTSAPDAGSAEAGAPKWAETKPRFVREIVSAEEPLGAFVVGNEILIARLEGGRFRVARLENEKLVDEDAWSRGLPAPQKSRGESAFFCNHIDAIFGRFPDRLWLIENSGGSMSCSSTFGEYVVWTRRNGSWAKDAVHSPPRAKPAGGIFATWPLGPAALGVGVSNLVGDTLSAPEDVMWTGNADPWATRAHLRREGWSMVSTCASPTGVVSVVSVNGGQFALETIRAVGPRATVTLPSPHAPDGPCAATENDVLFVQRRVDPTRRETLVSFDRSTNAWKSIAIPWPHRTTRLAFVGARIMAWTDGADGHDHVFLGAHDASAWTEVVGMPGDDVEVITVAPDDELLLLVDRTKLVRVGLPRTAS